MQAIQGLMVRTREDRFRAFPENFKSTIILKRTSLGSRTHSLTDPETEMRLRRSHACRDVHEGRISIKTVILGHGTLPWIQEQEQGYRAMVQGYRYREQEQGYMYPSTMPM